MLLWSALTACADDPGRFPIVAVSKPDSEHITSLRKTAFVGHPVPGHFTICHGNTCRLISPVNLTPMQWRRVTDIFQPPSLDVTQERGRIRQAVALLETLVGVQTGTDADLGQNAAGRGLPGQMDCIDEAANTTVYLSMLRDAGLLRFHTVEHRTNRGVFAFTGGIPHATAVIRDRDSGQRYAVDSWFLDNGEPPFIVPIAAWRAGWEP